MTWPMHTQNGLSCVGASSPSVEAIKQCSTAYRGDARAEIHVWIKWEKVTSVAQSKSKIL